MKSKALKTPCVGRCSTVYGDIVCRGCKRFDHEVVDWNRYSPQQKYMVWRRLETLLEQVIQDKFYIFDVSLLEIALERFHVNYSREQSPYVWLHQLIQIATSAIDDLSDCGVMRSARCQSDSLAILKQQIDQDYYQLSQGHYERYFSGAAARLVFE